MSFRHTYITEFLYRGNQPNELKKIEEKLNEFGTVNWCGHDNLGYFHGIIKDLDGYQTKAERDKIYKELEEIGVKIEIVFE